MRKANKRLQQIKNRDKIRLMTHVVIGYPTIKETIEIVKTMAESGADFIELQIPFSDPLADGPTIMRACEISLQNGTKVKDAFAIMKKLTSEIAVPLLFMAYYNSVFKYGVEKFCRDAKKAGAFGLIVPDMAIDEENEEHFFSYCRKYNLHNIQVISPVSTDNRLKKNAKVASGFVYCTARQGVTGARDQLDQHQVSYLEKVKKYFSVPIAVGFGITKKEQIDVLIGVADIAVVGSAIVDIISSSKKDELLQNVGDFVRGLR